MPMCTLSTCRIARTSRAKSFSRCSLARGLRRFDRLEIRSSRRRELPDIRTNIRRLCPRVFMASPLIDGDPPFHKDVGLAITKIDQVPKLVEEMQQAGVTTLKMYVGTNREIGQLVIAEGHRRGLIVTGHLGLLRCAGCGGRWNRLPGAHLGCHRLHHSARAKREPTSI